jgi:hypothetical protein
MTTYSDEQTTDVVDTNSVNIAAEIKESRYVRWNHAVQNYVSVYCGLTLDWHYDTGYVDVSMPGYINRALKKFNHSAPLRDQHAPHKWIEPAYGSQKPQSPTPESTAQPLDK